MSGIFKWGRVMLMLKMNLYDYYGYDHPEGMVKKEKYCKIDKNMKVEDLEKFIDDKLKREPHATKTFEIIKVEEE